MALKALLVTVSVGHWLAAFAVSPQYVLVSDKKTWQGALDYCRRTHGDLASVKGPVEMGLLAAAARDEDVWIGLAANSRGLWSWSDGGGLSFTAWSFGEPSDTQSCGRVKSGFWYDEDCDNKYDFVCSSVPGVPVSAHLTPNGSLSPTPVSMKADSTHSPRSTSGPPTSSSTSSKTVRVAPDPRTASSKRGTAFHLNLELMPWIEARKYCRAVHSDLASVPTTDVQMAITELLAGSTAAQRGAWLGLRKNRFMGNWYWVNDEAFDFSYWHEGEPSNQVWEQCGMVSANPGRNFSWADECCAARLPAICYSEL